VRLASASEATARADAINNNRRVSEADASTARAPGTAMKQASDDGDEQRPRGHCLRSLQLPLPLSLLLLLLPCVTAASVNDDVTDNN